MSRPSPELIELCGAVRDETATPEQVARLETILAGDVDARRFYRRFTQIHATLERYETAAPTARKLREDVRPAPARWRMGRLLPWLALAACLAIVAALFVRLSPPRPAAGATDKTSLDASDAPIALIHNAHAAALIPRDGPPVPLTRNVELRPSDLLATEATGTAVVRFADESTLFVFSANTRAWFSREGAAKIVHLTSGQMYGDVAPQKPGAQWRILTADGEATVLGTQLAVNARSDGTRVAVTGGRVRVTARDTRQSVETRAGFAAELTPTTATLVRLPPTEPTRVASFTVVDADTNAPLAGYERLPDGAVLDLATLPTRRINIRANCEPQQVGAVRFALEGTKPGGGSLEPFEPIARPAGWNITFPNQLELYFPYMLAGDPATLGQPLPAHSFAWIPPVGRYTLTAMPYGKFRDMGARGTPLTVHFEIVDGAKR